MRFGLSRVTETFEFDTAFWLGSFSTCITGVGVEFAAGSVGGVHRRWGCVIRSRVHAFHEGFEEGNASCEDSEVKLDGCSEVGVI